MAYRDTPALSARRLARREQLLQESEWLLREGGFAGLTMQGLADRAGVSVGALYRHFPSKQELAAEVFRRATEREVAAVQAALEQHQYAAAQVQAAAEQFIQRALKAPRQAWALIAEPVDPAVDEERLRYREAYAALFRRVIEAGMARGELPWQVPAVSAAALVGALAEALVGPLAGPPSKAVTAPLIAFCLRAVGAPSAFTEESAS
ncbi:TetR/AcrR family transcriptional regulator [Isoalcanivorax beigongshangi]|uniref:TetR/AcrR family transcriptional regulator n=1 Tax=Isoalcanivorax beigongshangi TaxID=3238810 RepID=A0ABV4AHY5_9GAMM